MTYEPAAPLSAPAYVPYPVPQPPVKGTSGLAITGLVFAFLVAPVGFILSIVGFVKTRGGRRKGAGIAIAGIIVSFLIMGATVALIAANSGKIATVADPGCVTGRSAILSNESKMSSHDLAQLKSALQATVNGLTEATAKATHSNVRTAMRALGQDYSELLNDVNTVTPPNEALHTRMTQDGDTADKLCTFGK